MLSIKPSKPKFIFGCLFFAGLFFSITAPSWITLWNLWTEDGSSYSHGPLVILVAVWLVFETWGKLQSNEPAPVLQKILALALGFSSSILWTIGYLSSIGLFQWLTLPTLAASIAIGMAKNRVRVGLFAPCIALYFALPVWELLVPPLQSLAVEAVSLTVKMMGIPAFIEGIEVTIPGGRFIVEGGCSGVRYLLVSVALTTLWSYLHITSTRKALSLVLLGIGISLVTNWVRIFLIVVIGYKTQMESSLVHDHEFFGWILFAFSLIPIMATAVWMEKSNPENQKSTLEISPEWHLPFGLSVILCFTILPIAAQIMIFNIEPVTQSKLQTKFKSPAFAETQYIKPKLNSSTRQILGGWTPGFAGIETWQRFEYAPSGLQILVGHIGKQSQTKELFSASNSFTAANISTQWLESTDHDFLELRNIYNQRWITKVFYRVSGSMTTGGLDGKVKQLYGTFKGQNDAQLIVIGFPCQGNCDNKSDLTKIQADQLNALFEY